MGRLIPLIQILTIFLTASRLTSDGLTLRFPIGCYTLRTGVPFRFDFNFLERAVVGVDVQHSASDYAEVVSRNANVPGTDGVRSVSSIVVLIGSLVRCKNIPGRASCR